MENKKISVLKVAATYIGTVVGAGFASGQETLQFFAIFKEKGLVGLFIVTILFIVFGYIIMDLGRELNSKSHLEIIKHTSGRFLGTLLDFLIIFFLFGALTAMIAGSGALVNQQFGINGIWGNLFMTLFTVITVLAGLKGVINSISTVVPFLIVSSVGISAFSILFIPPSTTEFVMVSTKASGLIGNWIWAAILYTSYNIVLAVSVLGPLGAKGQDKKTIRNGAILGGIGLGGAAIAIYFAVINNLNTVQNFEVPMLFIASRISYIIQIIYSIVLIAEIYTTAVGSLYGFSARITDLNGKKAKYIIIGTAFLAFIASQLGFSNLVKYLYPVVGYGGIILLTTLIITKFKTLKEAKI